MFKLEFKTSNAAFGDERDPEYVQRVDKLREVNRIMKNVTTEIAMGKTYGSIMDINGNKIGTWELD